MRSTVSDPCASLPEKMRRANPTCTTYQPVDEVVWFGFRRVVGLGANQRWRWDDRGLFRMT